jgi:hypothetical protein
MTLERNTYYTAVVISIEARPPRLIKSHCLSHQLLFDFTNLVYLSVSLLSSLRLPYTAPSECVYSYK